VNRRELITLLDGTAATWPLAARAQSTTVARVGFLRQAGPDDRHFDAFEEACVRRVISKAETL
jgi:hypothetical protein